MLTSIKISDLLSVLGQEEIVCPAFRALVKPPDLKDSRWEVRLTHNPKACNFFDASFSKSWRSEEQMTLGVLLNLITWLEAETGEYRRFRHEVVSAILTRIGLSALEMS